MTFDEVREKYAETNGSDLPIDDDTMELVIFENLVQNGGNIILVDDEIIKWCNDYADYMEADRYISQEEKDMSIKTLYESISCRGDYAYELRNNLASDTKGKELLERLEKIL